MISGGYFFMKRACIIFLTAIIIILSAVGLRGGQKQAGEYLRIHIRANSNEACDQAVKYVVRDEVVEFLTPIVSGCGGLSQAERLLSKRLEEISSVAEK